MPRYVWTCDNCKEEVEVFRRMADYKEPPSDQETREVEGECEHHWQRIIRGVSFQSTERHVGKNERESNRTFHELKESYKIESEMMSLPQEKRGEHQKAINTLRGGDSDKGK